MGILFDESRYQSQCPIYLDGLYCIVLYDVPKRAGVRALDMTSKEEDEEQLLQIISLLILRKPNNARTNFVTTVRNPVPK